MRYVLLIYSNPSRWEHPMFLRQQGQSEADRQELSAQFDELLDEITDSGEYIGGERLVAPERTSTVRVRDGAMSTTDGPYAEAKEHLAGYLIVECESQARAEAIAARFPDARYAAVEVRPVLVNTGMEM